MRTVKALLMPLGAFIASASMATAVVVLGDANLAGGAEIRILSAAAMQSV